MVRFQSRRIEMKQTLEEGGLVSRATFGRNGWGYNFRILGLRGGDSDLQESKAKDAEQDVLLPRW